MRINGQGKKKSNTGTLFIWGTILCLFIAHLLFYTWSRVQCVRVGYEITQETERHQYLMALQNNLKVELARLKSPDRISGIARTRFGLQTPKPEQVIVIP